MKPTNAARPQQNRFRGMGAISCLFVLVIFSCSNESRTDSLSASLCECFQPTEKRLSADTKEILATAGSAGDPIAEFRKKLQDYPEERQDSITQELKMKFDGEDLMPSYTDCVRQLRDKHVDENESREEKDKKLQDAIEGMKDDAGCRAAYGYFKVLFQFSQAQR